MQALSPEQSHSTKQVLLPELALLLSVQKSMAFGLVLSAVMSTQFRATPVTGAAPYGASLCSAETV